MPSILRLARILLTLGCLAQPAAAEDMSDFAAAVDRADAQYRVTLSTLETSSREQTAVEVRAFREAWQELIERLAGNHPALFKADTYYATTFTQVDAQLVGALIVIDIGNRAAARAALAPIGETLARLRERAEQN